MPGLEPYDDLREERRRRLADSLARLKKSQNNRPVTVAQPSRDPLFPNLPLAEPFNVDSMFPSADPNIAINPDLNPPLDQPAEDEDLPFGARALGNFFSAVSRGDTSGINLGGPIDFLEKPLEVVAKPFAVAGQGTLKVLEKSSEIGNLAASHVTNSVQQLMPGQQELERLVSQKRGQGMSHSDALEEAWEEISLGSLSVPFFRTALTPHGSITVGFKDVIAAGFDPVELALMFGTGGFSKALGVRGVIMRSGKESTGQALKTAVSQSIGVRGSRAIGRGVKGAPRFVGSGNFGVTDAIDRAVTGMTAEKFLREPVRVVGRIPDIDTLSDQTFKAAGKRGIVDRIAKNVPGARRIIGIASPARVAREEAGGNLGSEARVIYETSSAHGSNMVELASAWIQEAGDPERVFEMSRDGTVMAQNIKLSKAGRAAFKAKGLLQNPKTGRFETPTGFQFGDIAEFWVRGFDQPTPPVRQAARAAPAAPAAPRPFRSHVNLPEPPPKIQELIDLGGGVRTEDFMLPPHNVPATSERLRSRVAQAELELGRDANYSDSAAAAHFAREIDDQGMDFLEDFPNSTTDEVFERIEDLLARTINDAGERVGINAANTPLPELSRILHARSRELRTNAQRQIDQVGDIEAQAIEAAVKRGEEATFRASAAARSPAPTTTPVRAAAPDVAERSLFTGLTAQQVRVLNRMNRWTKEIINMMIEEGVYDNVDEALRGKLFRDTAGKVIDSEQALGDPSRMFHYMHRKVRASEYVDDAGEVQLLEYTRGGPSTGAVGRATSDFEKSRTYEFMQEGVREGKLYANPIETLQDFASAAYRRVAEKRAVDVLERRGKLVTSKQTLEKLYYPVIDKRIEAQSMYGSILRNVNRLKGKAARRKVKAPLLKKAIDTPATREAEVARRIQRLVDRETDLVLKYERHMERAGKGSMVGGVAGKAANEGAARRARKAADGVLGEYKERAKRIDELEILQQQHIDDQVAGQRRVNILETEMFGITDDIAQAEAELKIAQLTLKSATKEYRKTLERITDSASLDSRVFGGPEGSRTPVRMYKDGPLAGKLAPAGIGDSLTAAFHDRGSNILTKVEEVTGTARTLSAGSADIGWLSIQGGMLAFTHPAIWAKSAKQSIQAIGNPERLNKYVAQNFEDILSFIENGGDIGGSEFFQSISEQGGLTRISRFLEKKMPEGTSRGKYLDIWARHGQPIGRLGTGFNTFLDVSKIELWRSLRITKNAGHVTDGELARHINNMMGTLNSRQLGVSPTQRQLEGALFLFSPRFTRSAFALIGEMLRGPGRPGTLDGLAARESMRAMSGMIGGSAIMLTALAEALDKEPPELNPFKPGWLTMDVGNQSVGVGGSTRALLDAMAKSTAAVAGIDRREASDLLQWNLFNPEDRRANPMLSYWLNRTAPGIRELLTQETFDGEQLDTPVDMAVKGIAPKFLPFAAQEMLSPGPGVPRQSPIALIPESLGFRARPLSAYERLLAAQDKAARESDFGRVVTSWDADSGKGLSADEKDILEREQPELKRLAELARIVTNPVLEPYFTRVESDRQLVNDLINKAEAEFKDSYAKGILGGQTFREKHDDAVLQAFNLRQRREAKDGEFGDALEYLEESRERRLSSQTEFDRLYNLYLTEVRNNPVSSRDAFGNVRFREVERLENDFRAEVGEEMFKRIRRFHLGLDENGQPLKPDEIAGGELTIQLRRDKEVLREAGYWRVAEDIIGNDPEALALWDAFESAESPAQAEAFKREYPGLAKIEGTIRRVRIQIRRDNADVDAALIRWYGFRAQNKVTRTAERVFVNRARQDLQRQAIGSS